MPRTPAEESKLGVAIGELLQYPFLNKTFFQYEFRFRSTKSAEE